MHKQNGQNYKKKGKNLNEFKIKIMVVSSKYLGNKITQDGRCKVEIRDKIERIKKIF